MELQNTTQNLKKIALLFIKSIATLAHIAITWSYTHEYKLYLLVEMTTFENIIDAISTFLITIPVVIANQTEGMLYTDWNVTMHFWYM